MSAISKMFRHLPPIAGLVPTLSYWFKPVLIEIWRLKSLARQDYEEKPELLNTVAKKASLLRMAGRSKKASPFLKPTPHPLAKFCLRDFLPLFFFTHKGRVRKGFVQKDFSFETSICINNLFFRKKKKNKSIHLSENVVKGNLSNKNQFSYYYYLSPQTRQSIQHTLYERLLVYISFYLPEILGTDKKVI